MIESDSTAWLRSMISCAMRRRARATSSVAHELALRSERQAAWSRLAFVLVAHRSPVVRASRDPLHDNPDVAQDRRASRVVLMNRVNRSRYRGHNH